MPELLPQVQSQFPELTLPALPQGMPAGTFTAVIKKFGPVVATQDGSLILKTVQPPGKRAMSGGDWWNGMRLEIGEKWDTPPQNI